MPENIYQINNILHVIVGSVAMLGGLIALFVVKGSDNHKKAGKVFSIFLIISALSSLYPTFLRFKEIGPVAVIMAVASIYLIVTAIIAIRHEQTGSLTREKVLVLIPLVLLLLSLARVLIAIKTNNYEIFAGPLTLGILFSYCFITDLAVIRNSKRTREYWIKRHLTRMIFAFGFGVMALVRIGINFGLSFEMSLVSPLMAAFILVLFFRQRVQTINKLSDA